MSKRTNIVLIGMPGAGKSTIGILLARALGRHFLDTDVFIQAASGHTLHDLIETCGMKGFCGIEQEYIQNISMNNAVIATGGSVCYYEPAMQKLKENGIIIYFQLSLETLTSRIEDYAGRGVVMDPGESFASLYQQRVPLYEQYADVTVDLTGLTHEQSVKKIIDVVNKFSDNFGKRRYI